MTRRGALFGVPCAIVMDLACDAGGDAALLRLLAARLTAEQAGGDAAAMTAGLHPFLVQLGRLGFVRVPERFNPRRLHFMAREIAPDIGPDLFDPASWLVSLADWDVF